jgi:DUF1365 family protein
MKHAVEALYFGAVVHTRLRPRIHTLRYRVFSVLFDIDRLEDLDRRLRFFSRNRFNLVSLFDRDHGDGSALGPYLRGIAQRAAPEAGIERFLMLCYPRIFGYAFNPLTVYFGLDASENVRLTIYEVNNTFGQRHTYSLRAEPNADGVIWQQCEKRFFVSPFNEATGTYSFHVGPIGEELTLGVALRDADGPKLKAWFRGLREELTDASLVSALARTGWMTVKIIVAIHFEAARLRLKGLRLKKRPALPLSKVVVVSPMKAGHSK